MSHDRRRFLKMGLTGSAALLAGCSSEGREALEGAGAVPQHAQVPDGGKTSGPVVLSTWEHGMLANRRAWEVLSAGGSVLDAVEQGVGAIESDFSNRSVGLGGMPDRDGIVTLDACIQDHDSRAGSVAFVSGFEHPVSIARAVMERTPHVMLVGEGAERWALENGFSRKDLPMPDDVRTAWEAWKRTAVYTPVVNVENRLRGDASDHDTIGMIAMDANGRLAGSCTTSGMAWKVHGRVGDSPIIGAGLFVDGDVGAACATGTGELMIRTVGSHSVVELMRQGVEPTEACKQVVLRVIRKHPGLVGHQIGLLALRADGAYGAYGIYRGFNFAVRTKDAERLEDAAFERKE